MELIIRALYPRLSPVVIALFAFLLTGNACPAQRRIATHFPDAPGAGPSNCNP